VNPGYTEGEYDVKFDNGEMHVVWYTNSVQSHGFGKTKFNITAGTFEVKDWESDPHIWPHEKMYGYYSFTKGE